ncbi:CheB methylesterase domain-containing protein [Rhodobacter sp. 24-YEA-8]|uniref:CheB methylesterase domain-containing protein n=1 Tax=Rhodobacter sp. 24-YEA-8 TaxID=1884310 RepID=UPI00089AB158|nr:CheB methylesterase domain-containing protein [Rhodobacter sp. 24-YEA-8]SEB73914.1 CheB methylesterase [Rhodobacter sp. 24-YEA-8]
MKRQKVMIATARAISGARLSRRIGELPGYEICGQVQDLSSAYMLSESSEPALALIGSDLTRLPEFEGLLSLFRVAQTAWLEIPDSLTGEIRQNGSDPTALPGLVQWLESAKRQCPVTSPVSSRPNAIAAQNEAGGTFLADRIILIGASTGGIDALLTILSAFPANCPPCAIVQHTGAGFSDSLVRLFSRCCAAKVVPAAPGKALLPGTVVIGAGCPGHLIVKHGTPHICDLASGPPVSGHTPSVDILFQSALSFAPSVTAALLTGMGRDGAAGLLDLRRAGAVTFAQDEASSTVYGMPRAAVEIGAAMESLPLNRIAGQLLSHCRKRQPMPLAR